MNVSLKFKFTGGESTSMNGNQQLRRRRGRNKQTATSNIIVENKVGV
jgi:hypothetical protein